MTTALTIINDLLAAFNPELTEPELRVMCSSHLKSRARQAAAILSARAFVAGEGRGDEAAAAEAMRVHQAAQRIECAILEIEPDARVGDLTRREIRGLARAALPFPPPDRRLEIDFRAAMKLWRKHGGGQHGPHVETVTMPLERLEGFLVAILDAAMKPEEGK